MYNKEIDDALRGPEPESDRIAVALVAAASALALLMFLKRNGGRKQ